MGGGRETTIKDGASFCYCAYVLRINNIFARFKITWKKKILVRTIKIRKEIWGVATQFSEIIELKFGKKLPYILCILTLFLELWLLN